MTNGILTPRTVRSSRHTQGAPHGGHLGQPVLFINGDFDRLCDTTRSRLGEPMRGACATQVSEQLMKFLRAARPV